VKKNDDAHVIEACVVLPPKGRDRQTCRSGGYIPVLKNNDTDGRRPRLQLSRATEPPPGRHLLYEMAARRRRI